MEKFIAFSNRTTILQKPYLDSPQRPEILHEVFQQSGKNCEGIRTVPLLTTAQCAAGFVAQAVAMSN